ncbi:DNA starvation/stationary phase protection protein [Haloarcula sp. S1AR25-5A]|uniref:DNA starvation/stationary phase protection protein n=1 Tax=Haloarcula terrestris TaxID=2950533 RepID=A0AAE4JH79_9EURY|nr:DNA starvation/stationary phase protection protein DpsA [Haloarcula terrestris]MDS0220279.1 DNA starvation/stationary phase protection protein [Haloarcula terrestris]
MASTPHLRDPGTEHRRQEWDTVRANEIRMEPAVAEQLVTALNAELSGLYLLFNQVRKHYWTIDGAEWHDVTTFLESAADRLTEMTDDIALRVHALGGVPVCGPMGIRQHAPMHIETPHRFDARSSLERDLDGYATLAVQMRDHVDVAEQFQDKTTSELLCVHLKTLEGDAHTLQRFLADDTLVRND